MPVAPANPTVSGATFPGCGRKTQQCHPFIAIAGDIPKRVTNLSHITQVVAALTLDSAVLLLWWQGERINAQD